MTERLPVKRRGAQALVAPTVPAAIVSFMPPAPRWGIRIRAARCAGKRGLWMTERFHHASWRCISAFVAVSVALCGCSSAVVIDPSRLGRGAGLNERAAAAAISQYRAQYGLGPVVPDAGLTRMAAYTARANAATGTVSHDAGGSFQTRIAQAGLPRGLKAENLGAGTETFGQTLAMWQASPGHNVNLLLPQAQRVGIAYADAPGTTYGRFWAMVVSQ